MASDTTKAGVHGHLRLGELLTRAGLVPEERLREALQIQAERNVRLGALLVEMGLLDEVELNALLGLQSDLRASEATRLAEFLSNRLGSILGESGALAFQRAGTRPPERLRLGRLLVEAGVITQTTLDQALLRQRATGKRIGETLVEAGAISRETLSAFLRRQRRLIAVAAAGLGLLVASPGTRAGGSHVVQVEATVERKASISALRAPSYVVVTPADIARGYVEPAEPVEVDVRTNDPAGVMLGLQSNDPVVQSAEVLGDADVGESARSVLVRKIGTGLSAQTVRLRTRLRLGPAARPGKLPWPLAVFIAPA